MFHQEQPTHSPDDRLPDELAAWETRLASLSASAVGLDRDRLMFAAGQAAGEAAARRSRPGTIGRWAWPAASAVASAAAAVLVMLIVQSPRAIQLVEPGETEINSVEVADRAPPADLPAAIESHFTLQTVAPPKRASYLSDRQLALVHGVEALEYAHPNRRDGDSRSNDPPPTMRELLEKMVSKRTS